MIKVSVYYPNTEGSKFDLDYYLSSHMPMVRAELGGALKGMGVDAGIAGGAPGEKAPYSCVGHLMFESVEDFQKSFGPKAGTIMSDIPNYTDVAPVIQISNVAM